MRKCVPGGAHGPRVILRDVGFSVAKGEIVGVLGPSGAGKSTLLRIVVGLDRDFEGTVQRTCQRIGMAFQEPRLLPWLTVTDNIRAVAPERMRPDVDSLLDLVQLGGIGALYPRQLSLGMARRVGLARALAVAPDLLVLDEPFVSLDAQLGGLLFERVVSHARSAGTTVLVVTHDLAQALGRVSRLLVLAGAPTTLQGDLPVPERCDDGFRKMLLTRYSFLAADCGETMPGQRLPNGPAIL
ncbi:MAG TPA: ATP-binding cassette domain-containing protein [Rhodopila sp.]|nr:ATP-binding cassette domain-containing protein [Rhodopila sp.]